MMKFSLWSMTLHALTVKNIYQKLTKLIKCYMKNNITLFSIFQAIEFNKNLPQINLYKLITKVKLMR